MKKTVLANIYTLKTNKQKKISEAKEFIDGIYNKSVGKVLRIIEVNNASEESDFNNYIIIDNDNRPNIPAIKPTVPPTEAPTEDPTEAPTDAPYLSTGVAGNTTFNIVYNESTQTQVMTISPIQGTDGKLPDSYDQDIFGTYLSPLQVYQYGIIDENGEYILEPKWDGTPIDVIVEEGITEIPATTFVDCYINSLTLPESLISGTFERIFGCDILEIPANTIYIGGFGDSEFKHIIIGKNVQELGNRIFEHCLYLETLTFLSETPPSIGSFGLIIKKFEIYVTEESIELYKNHPDWQNVANMIKPIPKQTNLNIL